MCLSGHLVRHQERSKYSCSYFGVWSSKCRLHTSFHLWPFFFIWKKTWVYQKIDKSIYLFFFKGTNALLRESETKLNSDVSFGMRVFKKWCSEDLCVFFSLLSFQALILMFGYLRSYSGLYRLQHLFYTQSETQACRKNLNQSNFNLSVFNPPKSCTLRKEHVRLEFKGAHLSH